METSNQVSSLDAVFEHVKGAMTALEEGRPEAASKLLHMIYGSLAVHTLRSTNADPGSPHWMQLVKAIEKAFPPEQDWQEYVS